MIRNKSKNSTKFLLLLMLTIAIVFSGCSASNGRNVENEKVKVFVDERVELLSVVQSLAAYNLRVETGQARNYSDFYESYISDIETSFMNFKDHATVLKTQEKFGNIVLSEGSIACHGPIFDEEFQLTESTGQGISNAVAFYGGAEQASLYGSQLADFAKETDFEEFFEKNNYYYQQQVDKINELIQNKGIVNAVNDYFGYEFDSYNIIVSPLCLMMRSFSIVNDEGQTEVYLVMGIPRDEANWFGLLYHELSQAYTQALEEELLNNPGQLKDMAPIFNTINAYDFYPVQTEEAQVTRAIDKYVTHAVSVRLMSEHSSKVFREKYANIVKQMGFTHLDSLCEKLTEYENDREKYPTFDDFIPEIINFFADLNADQNG